MQLGMVGLGRMGANLVRRLLAGGHECVVYDLDPASVERLAGEGAVGAGALADLAARLAPPRSVWVMVPAGPPTEKTIDGLSAGLSPGDAILDGGNSYFKDDVRRAQALAGRGLAYLDVGTSGGVWGRERGYCLMIGGDPAAYARLEPIFATLAPGRDAASPTPGRENRASTADQGYLFCGPAGAGHFVKMVHNGIEYGLMQAYAEGFDLLASAGRDTAPEGQRYELPLADVAEVWRRGSVVGSWLLDLTAGALKSDSALTQFGGRVSDSGEGRWTLKAAIDTGVPAPVLSSALFDRFSSQGESEFADKLLSAMRYAFGGHVEKPKAGS